LAIAAALDPDGTGAFACVRRSRSGRGDGIGGGSFGLSLIGSTVLSGAELFQSFGNRGAA
jgi:hypothetical protein